MLLKMIMNETEYEVMAGAEQTHWWYRSLHQLVLNHVNRYFKENKICIVDAGCGTGGLINFMKQNGFTNIKGFDISEHATRHAARYHQQVFKGDIREIDRYFISGSVDVIISNDCLYFLNEDEQRKTLEQAYSLLSSNGLLILNMPALQWFRGMHDESVGIRQRFSKSKARNIIDTKRFDIVAEMYWPFLLSPFIWATRFWQRIMMKINPKPTYKSDLKKEPAFINKLLYGITAAENKTFISKPFGSSLFIALRKK